MAASNYRSDPLPRAEPAARLRDVDIGQTLPPATVSAAWRKAGPLVGVFAQLLLCLLVIHRFQLESRTFYHIALLSFSGFVVHALLPPAYRLRFFVALSLGTIVVAFGVRDAAWLLAISAVLIGICHIRASLPMRIALLLLAGAALAASRAGQLPAPWSPKVWPILGAMFMFRLALYLHGLRYDGTRPTMARTLAYFWMLPNACFPLFPVVDYTRFTASYYDAEPYSIYQTGARWIARGLIHLLLYRLVYFELVLNPAELADLGDLVQYLLATFLLYLRISGQFHLIVGMLCLFGFHLPETHRLYYLASSFTDFWRRINIYWKDFMMKLVYYPSFFRLRPLGNRIALVLATTIVFATTWLLHSYQWFWLRGGFPITATDALFWGVLGGLVVVDTLREAARPRRPRAGAGRWSAARGVRTVGTFCVICILWSLWSAESVTDWLGIWDVAGRADLKDVLLLAGLVAGGVAVAGWAWRAPTLKPDRARAFYQQPAIQTTAALVGLLLLTQTTLTNRLPPGPAKVIGSLKLTTLNVQDAALLHKGYYEKLDNVSRLSAQLWDLYGTRPPEWREGPVAAKVYRKRADFMLGELLASTSGQYHGATLTTNRWGMRDRDYQQKKPPGTYRIAMLGPSLTMGPGVDDTVTFDALLEDRLNREAPTPGYRYEVLNFGVLRYSLLQQLALLENRVFTFEPDMVVITAHARLDGTLTDHLMEVISRGFSIPYDTVEAILAKEGIDRLGRGVPLPSDRLRTLARRLGIDAKLTAGEFERRLRQAQPTIIAWALNRIVAECRKQAVVPVFLGLDVVHEPPSRNPELLRTARNAGFMVFDLYDVYDNRNRDSLRLADWDRHPNARAMHLIADRLFEELRRHESSLNIALTKR